MANPKAHTRLTPETAWWGFVEDEALMASVRRSARHHAEVGVMDAEDLLQEIQLWLATREADYARGNLAGLADQRMGAWVRNARNRANREESWLEWNDQWD